MFYLVVFFHTHTVSKIVLVYEIESIYEVILLII